MVVRRGGEGRVVWAIVGDGLDGGVILSFTDMLDEGDNGRVSHGCQTWRGGESCLGNCGGWIGWWGDSVIY